MWDAESSDGNVVAKCHKWVTPVKQVQAHYFCHSHTLFCHQGNNPLITLTCFAFLRLMMRIKTEGKNVKHCVQKRKKKKCKRSSRETESGCSWFGTPRVPPNTEQIGLRAPVFSDETSFSGDEFSDGARFFKFPLNNMKIQETRENPHCFLPALRGVGGAHPSKLQLLCANHRCLHSQPQGIFKCNCSFNTVWALNVSK